MIFILSLSLSIRTGKTTTGKTHSSTFDYEIWIKLFLSMMYSTTTITMTMMPNFYFFICIAIFHVYIVLIWLQTAHWPLFISVQSKKKEISCLGKHRVLLLPVFFLSFPRSAAHKICIHKLLKHHKKEEVCFCLLIYSVRQLEIQRQKSS